MKRIIAAIAIMLLITEVAAQSTFDFSVKGGINLCQIDGDQSGSYNKAGYNVGANTTFPLGQGNWRMLVGIGVSEKGAYVKGLDRTISLTYIEMPLLLTYNIGTNDGAVIRLGAGVAPAVLGKTRAIESGTELPEVEQRYKKTDPLPFCADLQYRFPSHIGVGVRYYNSLLSVNETKNGAYRIVRKNSGAFNRLLSFCISYQF